MIASADQVKVRPRWAHLAALLSAGFYFCADASPDATWTLTGLALAAAFCAAAAVGRERLPGEITGGMRLLMLATAATWLAVFPWPFSVGGWILAPAVMISMVSIGSVSTTMAALLHLGLLFCLQGAGWLLSEQWMLASEPGWLDALWAQAWQSRGYQAEWSGDLLLVEQWAMPTTACLQPAFFALYGAGVLYWQVAMGVARWWRLGGTALLLLGIAAARYAALAAAATRGYDWAALSSPEWLVGWGVLTFWLLPAPRAGTRNVVRFAGNPLALRATVSAAFAALCLAAFLGLSQGGSPGVSRAVLLASPPAARPTPPQETSEAGEAEPTPPLEQWELTGAAAPLDAPATAPQGSGDPTSYGMLRQVVGHYFQTASVDQWQAALDSDAELLILAGEIPAPRSEQLSQLREQIRGGRSLLAVADQRTWQSVSEVTRQFGLELRPVVRPQSFSQMTPFAHRAVRRRDWISEGRELTAAGPFFGEPMLFGNAASPLARQALVRGAALGKGRALVVADDRLLADQQAILPGNHDLLLDSLRWLHSRSGPVRVRELAFCGFLSGLLFMIVTWRGDRQVQAGLAFSIALAIGAVAAPAVNRATLARLTPQTDLEDIVFCRYNTTMELPGSALQPPPREPDGPNPSPFRRLYAAPARLGMLPRIAESLPDALRQRPHWLVIPEPVYFYGPRSRSLLQEHLSGGGGVLIVAGAATSPPVLATILDGISEIRLGDTPVTATAVHDLDGRELARGAFEFRPLTGGAAVLRETSGAICGAQQEVGGGAVVVVSLAAALRDTAGESELGEWLFAQLDRWRVKTRGELARISTDPARPF